MECGGPYPPKPAKVWAKSGPAGGQVTLYWDEVAYADRYAVAYGTKPGNYLYGSTNIGNGSSRSYTVSGLTGGMKYYFALAAARDCSSSPFSAEVTAWAGGGAVYVQSATGQGGSETSWVTPAAVSVNLSAVSGPKAGQVILRWTHKEDADTYHLVYGTMTGKYEYGALNIGKITEFTVGSLVPGKAYYFALVPVKGDRALYTGQAVRGVAKGYPVAEVVTNPVNIEKPEVMLQNNPTDYEEAEREAIRVSIEEDVQSLPQEEGAVNGVEDEYTQQYQGTQTNSMENIGGAAPIIDISKEGFVPPEYYSGN